jgi:hypothetical protein
MASSGISGQDKDCVSYLLSLKHRNSQKMTDDDMNLIIEKTHPTAIVQSQSSDNSINTASTVGSCYMPVKIPEPLFRTEEEISPNAVTMCRSGTNFPLFGTTSTPNPSTFGSYFSFPSHPHLNLQDQGQPQTVLLPKLKASKKKPFKPRSRPPSITSTYPLEKGPSSLSSSKPSTDSSSGSNPQNAQVLDLSNPQVLARVVGDSELVDVNDNSFIPDYIFLSMAQLQPCYVTNNDRIGTYKNRDLGFKGMSCKHCGGEPGFGRYFPETLRSLSQTTTSQTIVKHVAYKCRKTPEDIKMSVRIMKEKQDVKDQIAKEYRRSRFEERPKYGSRKVFFQRLWSRLHEDDANPQAATQAPAASGGKKSRKNSSSDSPQGKLKKPVPSKGRKSNKGKKSMTSGSMNSNINGGRSKLEGGDITHQTDCNLKDQFEKSHRKRTVSYTFDDNGENLPPAALKAE